jgi:hypothetical protein
VSISDCKSGVECDASEGDFYAVEFNESHSHYKLNPIYITISRNINPSQSIFFNQNSVFLKCSDGMMSNHFIIINKNG